MDNALIISQCVCILAGAFALVSLGYLLIQLSGAVKEATILMKLGETTLNKINFILDDINRKLDLLNSPVELVSRFFQGGFLKTGAFSLLAALTSIFRRKK